MGRCYPGCRRDVGIEEVPDFIVRARLAQETPARLVEDLGPMQAVIKTAVDRFQTHLRGLRKKRAALIEQDLDAVVDRLRELEKRFNAQLSLDLGEATEDVSALRSAEKKRMTIRSARKQKIERLFNDWIEWYERTRRTVDDPNPHVDVKAVFFG